MTRASRWRLAIFGGVTIVAGALFVAIGRGQEPAAVFTRTIIGPGLPGIDNGLDAVHAPLPPGGVGADWLAAMRTSDGRGRTGRYLPGSVIVKFRPGTGQNGRLAAMRAVDGTGLHTPAWANFDIMDIPAGLDAEDMAAELSTRPEVEYAQARYFVEPAFKPNDPLYTNQWGLHVLDMERVWDIQPGATTDIVVAVIDTGVAFEDAVVRFNTIAWRLVDAQGSTLASYPSLGAVNVPFAAAPELGATKFVAPRDFVWGDTRPFDLVGHGTHVAGTIAQLTDNGVGVAGMAFNVRIMPIKVLSDIWDFIFGAPPATDDRIAAAVRYAVENGAKVINMSIGRTAAGPSLVFADAVRFAVARGVFVVVSAGNSFEQGNIPNRLAETAPDIAGFVSVGSVGRALERSYYSTTTFVELVAPGGDQRRDGTTGGILQQTLDASFLDTFSDGPARYRPPRGDIFSYSYFQGTSMAAPHVAGFAALLYQQGITSPAAIEAAMKQFARDLGHPGVDTEYGSGLIQPRATLRGLGLTK